ncbi:MAG: hypothetical protein FJ147_21060 [Deltaproteobacteria bacterium]|nr:hypothetical protein [Deltaproteobacteria bacterium]
MVSPLPRELAEHYTLYVIYSGLGRLEDKHTRQNIFWYDWDSGPDVDSIERTANGEWVVTFSLRAR